MANTILRALVDWQHDFTEIVVDTGATHPITHLPLEPMGVRLDTTAWLQAADPTAALIAETQAKIATETAAIIAAATAAAAKKAAAVSATLPTF